MACACGRKRPEAMTSVNVNPELDRPDIVAARVAEAQARVAAATSAENNTPNENK